MIVNIDYFKRYESWMIDKINGVSIADHQSYEIWNKFNFISS